MKKASFVTFLLSFLQNKIHIEGIMQIEIVRMKESLIDNFGGILLTLYTIFSTHQNVATLSSKIPLQIGKILVKTSLYLLDISQGDQITPIDNTVTTKYIISFIGIIKTLYFLSIIKYFKA